MKKIKYILVISLGILSNEILGQSATSSGGGKMENSDVKVTVTLGEPTSGVIGDSTQTEVGFQQVYEAKDLKVEETKSSLNLTLYPNPTANKVTISNTTNLKLSYSLYNLQGKLIFSNTSSASSIQLDLSTQAKGIYVVKFVDTKNLQAKTFKITKK